MKYVVWAVLTLALLLNGGCAARSPQSLNHPNAINQLDDQAYDQLLTLQTVIEALKPEVKASGRDDLKASLNKAIFSYNAALDIYKAYHLSQRPAQDLEAALSNAFLAVKDVQLLAGKQVSVVTE